MRVGIISDFLNHKLTGIGNYVYNLVYNLQDINTEESIYLINNKKTNLFINFDQIIIKNVFPVLKTYGWYFYLSLKASDQKLDIIHNPTQVPTFFKFSQKYVITIHDITPFLFPNEHIFGRTLIFKLLFPKFINSADKIIAVSENTKADLMNHFKIPNEKIKVIYEGVNENFKPLDEREVLRTITNYNLSLPIILYVGTLEPRKNIQVLLKSFHQIRKLKANLPHKLVIIGAKGWKYKEIFETIDQLNLQDDVIFTGYVSDNDLPAMYNAADLFVYPSLYEGFGLPPLEAMACGTPVIVSNTSSLPEIVSDAGIMVDPHDIDGLANAIYNVLSDERLQKEMTEKGLKRAKIFSWNKCAKETLEVYEEVCIT